MFFFNRKHKLVDVKFFEGFEDFHSHILPGVDDGCSRMEKSLRILSYFEELGVAKVHLTPHVMKDYPNTVEGLLGVFDNLKKEYEGNIQLSLASEYMADNEFDMHLKSGLLPLYDNRVLIENSYLAPMQNFDESVYNVMVSGYTPVIAHPERYLYLFEDNLNELKERGCEMQLNLLSLSGYYGEQVADRSLKLLQSGFYTYLGTDIHRCSSFEKFMNKIMLSSKDISKLKELNNIK